VGAPEAAAGEGEQAAQQLAAAAWACRSPPGYAATARPGPGEREVGGGREAPAKTFRKSFSSGEREGGRFIYQVYLPASLQQPWASFLCPLLTPCPFTCLRLHVRWFLIHFLSYRGAPKTSCAEAHELFERLELIQGFDERRRAVSPAPASPAGSGPWMG
jgi:hypothetical protein